jgi:tRNA(Arg) A34 adenosine deaminase TadA
VSDSTVQTNPRGLNRRSLVRRVLGLATVALSFGTPRTTVRAEPASDRASANASTFMRAADRMRERAIANGDQAYGAVIVKGSQIVGRGPSGVLSKGDPTAHAEIEAIRDACRRLGTNDLSGCTMYGTSAPCAMCETAAYWARLDEVRFGSNGDTGRAPRYGGC